MTKKKITRPNPKTKQKLNAKFSHNCVLK